MSRINQAVIKAALAGGGVLFIWGVVYWVVLPFTRRSSDNSGTRTPSRRS